MHSKVRGRLAECGRLPARLTSSSACLTRCGCASSCRVPTQGPMRQAAAVEVGAIFGADVFQAIFAAMGVWIHTAIGTRSMLLAAAAVAQAVIANPLAHLFYCSVFQARPGERAGGNGGVP